jgi:hypothetical protein
MGALLGRRVGKLAALLVGSLGAGCGPDQVKLPAVPMEVVAVAAEYDHPTGRVPVGAGQPLQDFKQRLDTIEATRLRELTADFLVRLRTRLLQSGLATDPVTTPEEDRPVIRGSVTLNRTCRGWDDTSTLPRPADGAVDATAVYQASTLQRVVWGTATDCKDRITVAGDLTAHTFLDGSYALYLLGPLTADPGQAAFVMGWNGTIGTEAAQADVAFDFRWVPPQLEVRIPVSDGNIIGSVGAGGIFLRGSNGTFGCSLETLTCALPTTPFSVSE